MTSLFSSFRIPVLRFDKLVIPILIILVLVTVLVLAAVLAGTNVVDALTIFWQGTFGSQFGITSVLLRTTPLLLTGVGVAIAFRLKIINIGAEGQLYIGALVTTWIGLNIDLSSIIFIPLLFVVSFLAAGAWASIAAVLKVKFGINEIIVTFMMNFIAIYLVSWAILGPLKGPSLGLAQTGDISPSAILPAIEGTRIHTGIIIGISACIIMYYFLNKTKKGFQLRAVGSNPVAARAAGISILRSTVLAMIISGGLSGIAGMIEVTGIHHRLLDGISPGYGYTGIVIALVANLNPLGVIPTAFLFGATFAGSDAVHRIGGLPIGMVYAIQGIIVLAIISLHYKRSKF